MAFASCANLSSVTMTNVRAIQSNAFASCPKLAAVNFSDSLRFIGESAFSSCVKYDNVKVPANTTFVGENAFSQTKWEKDQKNEFVIIGDGVLYKYNGASEIIAIPSSVKRIPANRLDLLESIKTVIIPESVEFISKNAFTALITETNSQTGQQESYHTIRNIEIKGRKDSYASRFASHEYYTFIEY